MHGRSTTGILKLANHPCSEGFALCRGHRVGFQVLDNSGAPGFASTRFFRSMISTASSCVAVVFLFVVRPRGHLCDHGLRRNVVYSCAVFRGALLQVPLLWLVRTPALSVMDASSSTDSSMMFWLGLGWDSTTAAPSRGCRAAVSGTCSSIRIQGEAPARAVPEGAARVRVSDERQYWKW